MSAKRHPNGICVCATHTDRPWNRPEHWRAPEVDYLETWYGRRSDAQIAKHLGRTVLGVHLKARRLGLRKRDAGMTGREVAAIFGIDSGTVGKVWVRRGLLRASRASYRQGPHRVHIIDAAEVDRLHALWVLLATTGLREAEALGLTWEDVDLGDRAVPALRSPDMSEPAGRAVTGGRGIPPDVADPDARVRSPAAVQARPGMADDGPQRMAMRGLPDGSGGSTASVRVRHTLHRIEGQWQLRGTKTDKSRRTIPLPPVTVTALKEHRRRQLEEQAALGVMGREGMVFTTAKGQPLHGPNLSKLLYAHLDRLGLPRVSVHDLRHGAATILVSMGIPLIVVSRMLGHSTLRITADLYTHRVPELQDEAAERMQQALSG